MISSHEICPCRTQGRILLLKRRPSFLVSRLQTALCLRSAMELQAEALCQPCNAKPGQDGTSRSVRLRGMPVLPAAWQDKQAHSPHRCHEAFFVTYFILFQETSARNPYLIFPFLLQGLRFSLRRHCNCVP